MKYYVVEYVELARITRHDFGNQIINIHCKCDDLEEANMLVYWLRQRYNGWENEIGVFDEKSMDKYFGRY